jgi:hypothetical protein
MDLSIPVDLLPLAAADMREAAAAATWLREFRRKKRPKPEEHYLARIVESGMVVSYWRSFSKSKKLGRLPAEYVPKERRDLHKRLQELRNKVYAHVDEHPFRTAKFALRSDEGTGRTMLDVSVESLHFPPERLDEMITWCEQLAVRLELEAYLRSGEKTVAFGGIG